MNDDTQEQQTNDARLDGQARYVARKVGLKASKTRWRANSVDNYGGFQITDPHSNMIVAGVRYDMSAEQVIEFCEENKAAIADSSRSDLMSTLRKMELGDSFVLPEGMGRGPVYYAARRTNLPVRIGKDHDGVKRVWRVESWRVTDV